MSKCLGCGRPSRVPQVKVCEKCATSAPGRCFSCNLKRPTLPVLEDQKGSLSFFAGNPFDDCRRLVGDMGVWKDGVRVYFTCVNCLKVDTPLKTAEVGYRASDNAFLLQINPELLKLVECGYMVHLLSVCPEADLEMDFRASGLGRKEFAKWRQEWDAARKATPNALLRKAPFI